MHLIPASEEHAEIWKAVRAACGPKAKDEHLEQLYQPGLVGRMYLFAIDRDALQARERLGEHIVANVSLLKPNQQQPSVGLIDSLLPGTG
nr:hypothetical protein [Stenotrophomonas maltophilia]